MPRPRPLLLTTLCPERWALYWAFDNSGEVWRNPIDGIKVFFLEKVLFRQKFGHAIKTESLYVEKILFFKFRFTLLDGL